MRTTLLNPAQVAAGYASLIELYPHIPPMILWRGWELAAYRRFLLSDPVLDIGCGDGRYFRFVWPGIRDVSGVDMDPEVAQAARLSGVYREVYVSAAHELALPAEAFQSAFANCSLEHMDRLPEVLAGIQRSLRPGGTFLLSVVTDKWIDWATLPLLVEKVGELKRAQSLLTDYISYHHCVNCLAPEHWAGLLDAAGFEVLEHIPLVPEMTGRFFLFLDNLWHVRSSERELGEKLLDRFSTTPRFGDGLKSVLAGLLKMESDWSIGCGAVFHAAKRI